MRHKQLPILHHLSPHCTLSPCPGDTHKQLPHTTPPISSLYSGLPVQEIHTNNYPILHHLSPHCTLSPCPGDTQKQLPHTTPPISSLYSGLPVQEIHTNNYPILHHLSPHCTLVYLSRRYTQTTTPYYTAYLLTVLWSPCPGDTQKQLPHTTPPISSLYSGLPVQEIHTNNYPILHRLSPHCTLVSLSRRYTKTTTPYYTTYLLTVLCLPVQEIHKNNYPILHRLSPHCTLVSLSRRYTQTTTPYYTTYLLTVLWSPCPGDTHKQLPHTTPPISSLYSVSLSRRYTKTTTPYYTAYLLTVLWSPCPGDTHKQLPHTTPPISSLYSGLPVQEIHTNNYPILHRLSPHCTLVSLSRRYTQTTTPYYTTYLLTVLWSPCPGDTHKQLPHTTPPISSLYSGLPVQEIHTNNYPILHRLSPHCTLVSLSRRYTQTYYITYLLTVLWSPCPGDTHKQLPHTTSPISSLYSGLPVQEIHTNNYPILHHLSPHCTLSPCPGDTHKQLPHTTSPISSLYSGLPVQEIHTNNYPILHRLSPHCTLSPCPGDTHKQLPHTTPPISSLYSVSLSRRYTQTTTPYYITYLLTVLWSPCPGDTHKQLPHTTSPISSLYSGLPVQEIHTNNYPILHHLSPHCTLVSLSRRYTQTTTPYYTTYLLTVLWSPCPGDTHKQLPHTTPPISSLYSGLPVQEIHTLFHLPLQNSSTTRCMCAALITSL